MAAEGMFDGGKEKLVALTRIASNVFSKERKPALGQEALSLAKDAKRESFAVDKPVSLLVWNIHKGRKHAQWRSDAFSEIQGLQPDLTLLQEYVHETPAVPAKFFAEQDATMAVSFFLKPNQEYPAGVCTTSHVAVQSEKAFVSAHTEVTRTPKTALFTEYPIEGSDQSLGVINIHGINFVNSEKFQHFMDQLDSHAIAHVGPLIFAGDFNTWSKERVEIVNTIMQKHGLEEVPLPGATTHKARIKPLLRRFDFLKKGGDTHENESGLALDRVYTRGVTVIDKKVLSSTASDHNPLLIKFTL